MWGQAFGLAAGLLAGVLRAGARRRAEARRQARRLDPTQTRRPFHSHVAHPTVERSMRREGETNESRCRLCDSLDSQRAPRPQYIESAGTRACAHARQDKNARRMRAWPAGGPLYGGCHLIRFAFDHKGASGMADYIGAIDQGTTSTRFIVFDRAGRDRRHARRRSTSRSIRSPAGWSTIRRRSGSAHRRGDRRGHGSRAACSPATWRPSASPTSAKPPCCGIARPAEPVANALVWQDTRVADGSPGILARGRAGPVPREDRPAAGHLFQRAQDPLAAGPCPRRAREQAEAGERPVRQHRHLSALTGSLDGGLHITDCTNASRTQLMNLATLDWDPELLSAFGIPRQILPEIRSSSEVYGAATLEAVEGRAESPASWATSRPRWWARPASVRARPRTPTAPAASC